MIIPYSSRGPVIDSLLCSGIFIKWRIIPRYVWTGYFCDSLLFIEGKRPLGRPWRRWEDNIRMDVEEIDINAGNWVDSAQDRDYWRALVNAALNLRVP